MTPNPPSDLGQVTNFQATNGGLWALMYEPHHNPYLTYWSTWLMIAIGTFKVHVKKVGREDNIVFTISNFLAWVKNWAQPVSLLSILFAIGKNGLVVPSGSPK